MYTPTNEAGRLVSIEFEHSEVWLPSFPCPTWLCLLPLP